MEATTDFDLELALATQRANLHFKENPNFMYLDSHPDSKNPKPEEEKR